MGQNNQEYRLGYWATRLSVRSFACTAHFTHSLARRKVNDWMAIYSKCFSYSGPLCSVISTRILVVGGIGLISFPRIITPIPLLTRSVRSSTPTLGVSWNSPSTTTTSRLSDKSRRFTHLASTSVSHVQRLETRDWRLRYSLKVFHHTINE